MKLHLIAFPHTRVTPEFSWCAYTGKILKFCRMMGDRYPVVLYAPEGSDPGPGELVECLSDAERVGIFGPDDPNNLPAWPGDPQNELFLARAIVALADRLEPGDLILLAMGYSQRAIAHAFPKATCIEPGVGYEGVLPGWRAFESYAWMHHVYGKQGCENPRAYDAVIPNYFDPADFPDFQARDDGYLLFMGRMILRKGPNIAAEVAKRTGFRLVVAGAGAVEHRNSRPHRRGFVRAPEVYFEAPHLEYVGPVGVQERSRLMAGAAAVIVPTLYLEPFGGVAVEAMMAGAPVVASDFGAFTETVREGVSGYRFHTIPEACHAFDRARDLDRARIRQYALDNYSLEAVAPMFDAWFQRIDGLRYGPGTGKNRRDFYGVYQKRTPDLRLVA